MAPGLFDYTRCVKPDGTAYGTKGKCRKGQEAPKENSFPFKAAVTQGRFNIPHSGHAKLIKGLLKKAPVVYVVMGKGKENVDQNFRSQMLRAVLRGEGVDLNRVKIVKGSGASSVLKELSSKVGKENVVFMLGEDQTKFLDSMGKSLGVKTAVIPRDASGASSSNIRRLIDAHDEKGVGKEFDNDPYLMRLAGVARKVEKNEFSEVVESNSLDFVRCMRPNGTFYGTSGTCRKGSKTEPATRKVEGKFLGGGKEGRVYDIDRSRVLKVGRYGEEAARAHSIAASEGLAPRLFSAGVSKSGKGYQVMERLYTSDIPGLPHPGSSKPGGKEIEELDSQDLHKEKEAYKAVLSLNQKGVSHEDLHGGNLKWDESRQRPVIMDFDNAVVNSKAARAEASATLTSIGIRLENSGYYDEADRFYKLGVKLGKASDKTGYALLQKAVNLVDDDYPE